MEASCIHNLHVVERGAPGPASIMTYSDEMVQTLDSRSVLQLVESLSNHYFTNLRCLQKQQLIVTGTQQRLLRVVKTLNKLYDLAMQFMTLINEHVCDISGKWSWLHIT